MVISLNEVRVGQSGVVEAVDLPEEVSYQLAHLGFLPGAGVKVLRRVPAGDPTVYRLDGVEVGLRGETARHIQVVLEQVELEPVELKTGLHPQKDKKSKKSRKDSLAGMSGESGQ